MITNLLLRVKEKRAISCDTYIQEIVQYCFAYRVTQYFPRIRIRFSIPDISCLAALARLRIDSSLVDNRLIASWRLLWSLSSSEESSSSCSLSFSSAAGSERIKHYFKGIKHSYGMKNTSIELHKSYSCIPSDIIQLLQLVVS